ncbi:MAG TPA: energy transducer TonB [Pyrinomonadaceae bacterium]|nr:energy transducer TonB [Pyrinomonadaceae bacterium]
MKFRLALAVLFVALGHGRAAADDRRVSVGLLDMGGTPTAARVAERLSRLMSSLKIKGATLALHDRGMSAAAARGVGYAGSLNLTLAEARALGAALGCDFFLTGDAQTVRRSSSARPVYFESYASVFVVSTRSGRLVHWDRPAAEADTAEAAEASLLAKLEGAAQLYAGVVMIEDEREERERFAVNEGEPAAVIDLSTDEGAASNKDLREPAPYRRLRPAYTDAAARAEAEATVDALVEIGADGEVAGVRVVRWAGFGLDEEVVATVRRMRFRPAQREGEPVPVRVLLRYNFRKPPKS